MDPADLHKQIEDKFKVVKDFQYHLSAIMTNSYTSLENKLERVLDEIEWGIATMKSIKDWVSVRLAEEYDRRTKEEAEKDE